MKTKKSVVPCACIDSLNSTTQNRFFGTPLIQCNIDETEWKIYCPNCRYSSIRPHKSAGAAIKWWNHAQIQRWQHRHDHQVNEQDAIFLYRVEDEQEFKDDEASLKVCQQVTSDETWIGYTLEQLKKAYKLDTLKDLIVCEYLATCYTPEEDVTLFVKTSALLFKQVTNIEELYSGGDTVNG